MKKYLLLTLCLFLVGCEKTSPEQIEYQNWIKELEQVKERSGEIPFKLDISIEELVEGEYQYHLIIDEPKEEIKNLKALVIHNQETEDVFPSIGIYDDPITLIPGKEDVKGIALVGYLKDYKEDTVLKIKIEYESSGVRKRIYEVRSFDKK